jgi:hypothetical protein
MAPVYLLSVTVWEEGGVVMIPRREGRVGAAVKPRPGHGPATAWCTLGVGVGVGGEVGVGVGVSEDAGVGEGCRV